MAGFAVLTVGILHGANDLEILSKKFKGSLNHLYTRFLILYLMVVLLGAAFFFIIPSFTLILFVIFSSYHFGEQHWGERLSMNYANFTFYTLYGALVFFMIFTLQYDDVVFIINEISGYTLNYEFFFSTSIGLGIILIVWALLIEQLRIHFIFYTNRLAPFTIFFRASPIQRRFIFNFSYFRWLYDYCVFNSSKDKITKILSVMTKSPDMISVGSMNK